ncbi:tRNA (cytosine(38)-C(5))-methyltransferase-like [Liolophura sinensis]|uniref:tRNA (cytosine(38)-C(5))-methyltransferase-like n=1 Tax=Liolophura sinensis TaxID=3198878 RepID=UPI00315929C6
MIVMSPPCQPFTRMGRQKDLADTRTNSFSYLLTLLQRQVLPARLSIYWVENVKGFETSQARGSLLETLGQCQYIYQEFMLTPLQFGIPNSRLRYYLIAQRKAAQFSFVRQSDIVIEIPECCTPFLVHKDPTPESCNSHLGENSQNGCILTSNKDHSRAGVTAIDVCEIKDDNSCSHHHVRADNSRKTVIEEFSQTLRQQYDDDHRPYPDCQRVENFLEENSLEYFQKYLLSDKELRRFIIMDIVPSSARKTSCFARRYGNFIEGGGSVFLMTDNPQAVKCASEMKTCLEKKKGDPKEEWPEHTMVTLRDLQLRWFTPREMANLLCFPASFSFPEDVTRKQMYKCLGNSLNVHVVSVLIRLLLMEGGKC